METLRSYKELYIEDYLATLSKEEQDKYRFCAQFRCYGGERCAEFRDFLSLHDEKFDKIREKHLNDFCATNQHIVPTMCTELAAANPSIKSSFFVKASDIPLVVHNDTTSAAWEFSGSDLIYRPDSFTWDRYDYNFERNGKLLRDAQLEVNRAQCDMERNPQDNTCKVNFAKASANFEETMRMCESYTSPIKEFSISTGQCK